jgi:hypothetical protein
MFVYGTMNSISYVLLILAPFFELTEEENCTATSSITAKNKQPVIVCTRIIIRQMADNSRTATSQISGVRLAGGTAR